MFKLLRLPQLAQHEILRFLCSTEVFNFSLCSKKALYTISSALRSESKIYALNLTLAQECSLSLGGDVNTFFSGLDFCFKFHHISKCSRMLLHITTSAEISGVRYQEIISHSNRNTYWEDPFVGLKLFTEHIQQLFHGIVFRSVTVDRTFSGNLLAMLDLVNSRQTYLNYLVIRTPNELTTILNRFQKVGTLRLDFNDSALVNVDALKCDQLVIDPGSWVTLPNLLAMNSKRLRITNCNLTSSDINAYLKLWIQGGCSQLEFFTIKMKNPDFEVILEDVPSQENGRNNHVQRWFLEDRITMAYDIQHPNGSIATIDCTRSLTECSRLSRFRIQQLVSTWNSMYGERTVCSTLKIINKLVVLCIIG